MNEEIKDIINKIEERLTVINIIKEPINADLDKAIKLSVAYENLLKILNELKKWLNEEINKENNISKNNLSSLPTNREKILKEVFKKIKELEDKEDRW